MKKSTWFASILGLVVAAGATMATSDVPVEELGNYASQQSSDGSGELARRHRGSSGSYGSSGGRRVRNRGSSGSFGRRG